MVENERMDGAWVEYGSEVQARCGRWKLACNCAAVKPIGRHALVVQVKDKIGFE